MTFSIDRIITTMEIHRKDQQLENGPKTKILRKRQQRNNEGKGNYHEKIIPIYT
jgi:stalled ribosome alternative rescue factor ArfA